MKMKPQLCDKIWVESPGIPHIFLLTQLCPHCSTLYVLMQHAHASLQVEGEVRGGSIAVRAMRSSVEETEEDPREATTTVEGVGRLHGGAWHPRRE